MNEIEKMYENAGIKRRCSLWHRVLEMPTTQICEGVCDNEELCSHCLYGPHKNAYYPPFTAEKQLEIENVILQDKRNYNKWIEYNINAYGEWVIRFIRTDKFAPYVVLGKTRAEALANVINKLWQDLTPDEKQQIKEILEE
mgnify:CR=1 FL=1